MRRQQLLTRFDGVIQGDLDDGAHGRDLGRGASAPCQVVSLSWPGGQLRGRVFLLLICLFGSL